MVVAVAVAVGTGVVGVAVGGVAVGGVVVGVGVTVSGGGVGPSQRMFVNRTSAVVPAATGATDCDAAGVASQPVLVFSVTV